MSEATVTIETGAEFASAPYLLDANAADAYRGAVAGPPRRKRANNIHNDDAAAKKAGYRAPIAAGEQTYAVLANFLVDLFGVDFLRGGRLEAAFTKPVFYGDRLTSHARVTTASGSAIEVEVWVDNDRGERVAIGTAGFNARPA